MFMDPDTRKVAQRVSDNDMIGYETFPVLGSYCFPNLAKLPSADGTVPKWAPLGSDEKYKDVISSQYA